MIMQIHFKQLIFLLVKKILELLLTRANNMTFPHGMVQQGRLGKISKLKNGKFTFEIETCNVLFQNLDLLLYGYCFCSVEGLEFDQSKILPKFVSFRFFFFIKHAFSNECKQTHAQHNPALINMI